MNLSAVLLAGGESRRMGCDKATLNFGGKPLWQHQLDTLRALQQSRIFVSARKEPGWMPNDVAFIRDQEPSRGPITGLASTLSAMDRGHLIALAIDMPFMTSAFLMSLAEGAAAGIGVIPRIGDRFEPLAAIYPYDSYVDFAAALENNELALQIIAKRLIGKQKLRVLDLSENQRGLFRNFNEPADIT